MISSPKLPRWFDGLFCTGEIESLLHCRDLIQRRDARIQVAYVHGQAITAGEARRGPVRGKFCHFAADGSKSFRRGVSRHTPAVQNPTQRDIELLFPLRLW
jgi:hypothetical protein